MDLKQRRRMIMQMIGGGIKLIELGTYTPTEDVSAADVHIPHNLGVVPDFVVVMADEFAASTELAVDYLSNAYCSKANLIASNKTTNGFSAYQRNQKTKDTMTLVPENVNYTKFMHDSYFLVPYYSTSDKLKGGITYHYVIGKYE